MSLTNERFDPSLAELDRPSPWSEASVLRGALISSIPGVRHGFTGRVTGLGRAAGNVGFSAPRDQADAWAMRQGWCAAVGVDPDRLVTLGQIHGAEVIRVSTADAGRGAKPGSGGVGLGDALITDDPGVVLMTLHADCLPIVLVDPARPAIAAIHAGWRGTVAGVAGATVQAMQHAFGVDPADLIAFLGPAISRCCYEVGPEVAAAWQDVTSTPSEALRPAGERWTFDLRAANLEQLQRAGLHRERLEISAVCTRCDGERWFSHRGQGAATGRFGAIVAIDR